MPQYWVHSNPDMADLRECARGPRCLHADRDGNPNRGPRAFCDRDRDELSTTIADLPRLYAELWTRLPAGQTIGEKVSGTPGWRLPFNLTVYELMRTTAEITFTWATAVQRIARLADPATITEATRLQDACQRVLSPHVDALIALEPVRVARHVPVRDGNLDPDALALFLESSDVTFTVDAAGAYTASGWMDGARAGLELLGLHSRLWRTLGYHQGRRRVPEVTCDACSMPGTLVQREALAGGWEERVFCTECRHAYIGVEYTLLMGRVWQVQRDTLNHHTPRHAEPSPAQT